MAKTKKAAQPAKDASKTAPKAGAQAQDEATAGAAATTPARGKKTEKVWDSSKGYTGTQSDYKPPDTDPAQQTVNKGRGEQ